MIAPSYSGLIFRGAHGFALLVAMVGLSGCLNVFIDNPGKVVLYEGLDSNHRERPSIKSVKKSSVNQSRVHIVRSGDTVYQISRRYDAPIRAIIETNRLRPPYVLKSGVRLTLPPPQFHTVRQGDTIYGVSRRYNLAMNELVRSNNIAPPYQIIVGEKLKLYAMRGKIPPAARKQTARKNSTPAVAAANISPPQSARVVSKRPALRPNRTTPPRAGKLFLLPVRGKVISRFGPKQKGLHNDGINITAPSGASVRAAENGIVVYSGNELLGYGNMVLLRHADGYMTAYGHNGEILVRKGQRVRRGQVISKVGSTGNVSVPQLHFEIRKGKTAVNPAKFIKGLS
jgi:murein DD-endopeptidase MepM/ murein hydrolase activator NlpD